MAQPAKCAHCDGPLVVSIDVDDGPILDHLHKQDRRLARIERALGIIHAEQEHDMAELDDRLAEIAADEDAEHAQLARLIADFEAAGTLSDAQRAALDAIKSHIVGDTTAITDADPEPAPPADVPAPDAGAEVPTE